MEHIGTAAACELALRAAEFAAEIGERRTRHAERFASTGGHVVIDISTAAG